MGEQQQNKKGRANVLGANVEEGAKPPRASALLFEGIAAKNKKILGEEFEDSTPVAADAGPLRGPGEDAPKIPDLMPVLKSGVETSDLSQCPGCKRSLLRPGIVWFGEPLPTDVVDEVDALLDEDRSIYASSSWGPQA